MKKRLILGLACTLMLGVGGCMDKDLNEVQNTNNEVTQLENVSKDNQKLIDNMLNYVNKKYNEDFIAYKFTPSAKGLTMHQSQSVLFARNSNNMKIRISESNENKGLYKETYYDVLIAKYIKEELLQYKNFDGEFSVSVLTYGLEDISEDYIKENLQDLIDELISFRVSVYTEGSFSEENLMDIYKFYSDIQKYNSEELFFHAASNVSLTETLAFLEQEQYYRNLYSWYQFDTSIQEYLWIMDRGEVTFEQFRQLVEKVGE